MSTFTQPITVTLTKPTAYKGSLILGRDGIFYAVGASTVVVPANIAAPFIAAGLVPNGA